MCLESCHERTVNYTKIIPKRAWGRDGGRNTNTTECNLEIHVYPFYLCKDRLSSASIRGICAALQDGRQERGAPVSRVKCGPVPSSSDAEPSSLISLCQHLNSSCCRVRAFLHSKPIDFKQLNANVQMPTGPLAVAQLLLPVLLNNQERPWAQGLSSYLVWTRDGFLQAAQLCRSYSNITGKKKEGFFSMVAPADHPMPCNRKCNAVLLIISGWQWITSLLLAYAWL